MDDVAHWMPMDDIKRHELSKNCWCNPTQDDEHLGVWVHHAADGRESYEQGRKPH